MGDCWHLLLAPKDGQDILDNETIHQHQGADAYFTSNEDDSDDGEDHDHGGGDHDIACPSFMVLT